MTTYQPHAGGKGGAKPGAPRRFSRGRKACTFCVEHIDAVDYKSVNRLRRYMSDRARLESGKRTGTCARHQRMVRTAIKRARIMGLLAFAPHHLRVTGPVSSGPRGAAAAVAAEEAAATEVQAVDEEEVGESTEEMDDVPQTEDSENETGQA
jgi:small subunit ribosomal protein S18